MGYKIFTITMYNICEGVSMYYINDYSDSNEKNVFILFDIIEKIKKHKMISFISKSYVFLCIHFNINLTF